LSEPLDLDSPRWKKLSHAYGSAEDIPGELQALREGDEEALDSLFGSILHQGTVYSASMAALPHLEAMAAAGEGGELNRRILVLAASIAGSRDRHWKSLPEDIEADAQAVLPGLREMIEKALLAPENDVEAVYLLQSLAGQEAVEGLAAIFQSMEQKGNVSIRCPSCRKMLAVAVDAKGFSAKIDRKTRDNLKPRVLTPQEREELRSKAFGWLDAQLARPGLTALREGFARLKRPFQCPECAAQYELATRLLEESVYAG
jgi:hypothetical protein